MALTPTSNYASEPLSYLRLGKDNSSSIQQINAANKGINDPFFDPDGTAVVSNDELKWDKLFPYELLILKTDPVQDAWEIKHRFVLPIPPQELNTQTPFAIVNTLTMGAVTEEHNSTPIRMIALSGTTGVNPLRPSLAPKSGQGQPYIAGGSISATTQAAGELVDSFNSIKSASQPVITAPPKMDTDTLKGTGYYQFRLLQAFLEGYAAMKKTGDYKDYYLGFAVWKERAIYIVTPMMFNVRRSVGSPLEYSYDLQFKAFRRITSSDLAANSAAFLNSRSVMSTLSKIMNTLMAAYKTAMKLIGVIRAVRQDIQAVLNQVRSAILFLKAIVNAAIELINLPASIIKDFRITVLGAFNELKDTITALKDTVSGFGDGIKQAMGQETAKTSNAMIGGPNVATNAPPSMLDDVFNHPEKYPDLLSAITLDNLSVDEGLQQRIDAEIDRVKKLKPSDFQAMREQTLAMTANLANALGAGDPTFDAIYGITEPEVARSLSLDEFTLLSAFNDIADALGQMALTSAPQQLNTIDYIAGYASQAGVAFQKPVSKYAVPFPYDFSLEQLARMYLGDANRWVEIAALNGLREPYIDEVGFTENLVNNGSGTTVLVSDITNLRIGQAVWLQSNAVFREKRHIVNIKTISSTQHRLTLDGAPDLAKFVASAGAYLHAFLPDTVNSLQLIYIPTQTPGITNEDLAAVPGVDAYDQLLQVSGVDLLLTNDNDLAITPDGDVRFAYGMANIIQQIRLTLGTPRGSLIQHADWGLALQTGISIADLSAQDMAANILATFKNDPAFEFINSVNVNVAGPVAKVLMSMNVYGLNRPLDVAVQVTR